MTNTDDAPTVAVVGSPSSNSEVTLDLLAKTAEQGLVGSMLFLVNPVGAGRELAMGTVTEVVTRNQWHETPALRGVVSQRGHIPNLSGASGDVRGAGFRIQAAYRQDAPGQPWRQSGPNLRMSPATGTPIRRMTDEVIGDLIAGEPDVHYLGPLYGGDGVRLPLNIPDFAGPQGAIHLGVFGKTGAGKTSAAAYLLAGQMRHPDLGMIVVDPQGQWAGENGLPFSLQSWAAELGREVVVRRISTDLRLAKDAPLLGDLLGKTKFTATIMKMAGETQELFLDELVKLLRKRDGWDEEPSPSLLTYLLTELDSTRILGRVYADQTKQDRLSDNLKETLDDPADLLHQFGPLHNLFGPNNPTGGKRYSMWGAIAHVFDTAGRKGRPAPLLILDMSTEEVSWDEALDDEDARAARAARAVLDEESVKAAILAQTFRSLKQAAESAFRDGNTLNTLVTLDEGWRFAPPVRPGIVPEIAALSGDLAGYTRDFRKFGVGLMFITQAVKSLNPDIWDQLGVRLIGYGLGGTDLDRVVEHLDDRDSLKLYRSFAPPRSTGNFPWMIVGPVSPLSFTSAPLFLSAYTDFGAFREDNRDWIALARASQGLPVMTGTPGRAAGTGTVRRTIVTVAGRPVVAAAGGRDALTAAAARTRALTVEAEATAGPTLRPGDPTFGSGLDGLDDEGPAYEPPF